MGDACLLPLTLTLTLTLTPTLPPPHHLPNLLSHDLTEPPVLGNATPMSDAGSLAPSLGGMTTASRDAFGINMDGARCCCG